MVRGPVGPSCGRSIIILRRKGPPRLDRLEHISQRSPALQGHLTLCDCLEHIAQRSPALKHRGQLPGEVFGVIHTAPVCGQGGRGERAVGSVVAQFEPQEHTGSLFANNVHTRSTSESAKHRAGTLAPAHLNHSPTSRLYSGQVCGKRGSTQAAST